MQNYTSCHCFLQVELIAHLGEHQREEFRKMKFLMEEATKLREEEDDFLDQVKELSTELAKLEPQSCVH